MIYEITLETRYFDQQCINRWNYLSTGTPTGVKGSEALVAAMGFIPSGGFFTSGTIADQLQGISNADVTFVSVLSKAIREAPLDFYDNAFPSGVVGTAGGTGSMSPVIAYGFRTNRTRQDVSRATKRFVGANESQVGAGGVIDSGLLTALDNLASLMSATLSYTDGGNSLTFAPVVCSKYMYTAPPAKKAYRYYPTIATQLEHTAQGISWNAYRTVRSQVSRQYGHGQ